MNFDAGGDFGGWRKRLDAGTPITPPTVVRENYDFIGWSPTPPETMPDHDVTCVAQWQEIPIVANVHVDGRTAICDNVTPVDSTIQYSLTSSDSGYSNGNTFTLEFDSEQDQTRYGWFKISHDGLDDLKYQVTISQTVSQTWS